MGLLNCMKIFAITGPVTSGTASASMGTAARDRLIAKLRLPGVVRSERQHRNICFRIKLVARIIKSAVLRDLGIFIEPSQAVIQPQTSLFVLYVTTTVAQAETRCVRIWLLFTAPQCSTSSQNSWVRYPAVSSMVLRLLISVGLYLYSADRTNLILQSTVRLQSLLFAVLWFLLKSSYMPIPSTIKSFRSSFTPAQFLVLLLCDYYQCKIY
jgi:hypothetical protein